MPSATLPPFSGTEILDRAKVHYDRILENARLTHAEVTPSVEEAMQFAILSEIAVITAALEYLLGFSLDGIAHQVRAE